MTNPLSSNSADAVAPTPSPETKTTGGSANASPVLSTGISIIPPAPSVIILPELTTAVSYTHLTLPTTHDV